jgi:hydroxymethylpyrimidine pyrophosphatase-like HAD family hydrolase
VVSVRIDPADVRLVATDLDGTIVRRDGTISARTVRALAAVERSGRKLVLVTGRPVRWMGPVVESTGHRGVAICANGAVVYDLHEERLLQWFPLSPQISAEVVTRVRAVIPDAGFAAEFPDGFGHDDRYHPRWDVGTPIVAPIEELIAEPVTKLLVRHDELDGDAMLALVRPVLDGVAEPTHSSSNDGLLEICAPGVSKATTLARLAKQWGIDAAQVIAFGDMPNDVPMLRWAGWGFAMAGAHPEAVAAAPHVTESVANDGVALVIESVIST